MRTIEQKPAILLRRLAQRIGNLCTLIICAAAELGVRDPALHALASAYPLPVPIEFESGKRKRQEADDFAPKPENREFESSSLQIPSC
jgi:hypothetical protein